MIDPIVTYFSKYYTGADFELMVTNKFALQTGKPWKNTEIREDKLKDIYALYHNELYNISKNKNIL